MVEKNSAQFLAVKECEIDSWSSVYSPLRYFKTTCTTAHMSCKQEQNKTYEVQIHSMGDGKIKPPNIEAYSRLQGICSGIAGRPTLLLGCVCTNINMKKR